MKRLLLLLLTVLLWSPLLAEDDGDTDACYGVSASVDRKLAKGLHVEAETEVRLQNAGSGMERWTLGLGMDYKLASWLKVDGGYEFLNRYKPERTTAGGNRVNGYWSPRHRWYAGLTGAWAVGRWSLSLRERYQGTHAPLQYVPKYRPDGFRLTDEAEEDETEHLLRSRLQAKYNIRHCKFSPSASIELHQDMSSGMHLDEVRYVVGGDYKLTKTQTLNLHCRYEERMGKSDGVVVLVGYGYAF